MPRKHDMRGPLLMLLPLGILCTCSRPLFFMINLDTQEHCKLWCKYCSEGKNAIHT
jgi:hypothetical protein